MGRLIRLASIEMTGPSRRSVLAGIRVPTGAVTRILDTVSVGKICRVRRQRSTGNCFGIPPEGEIRFQAHLFLITFPVPPLTRARSFLFQ